MKNQELKTNIEIEGIILTPELVKYIKHLQANDNEFAKEQREIIADIICDIGKEIMVAPASEIEGSAEIIYNLSHMRDRFKYLMKPLSNTEF